MGKSRALKKAVGKLDDTLKTGHDVTEVTPNTTSPNTKKQGYQFAGSKSEIASQVSSFMATYEYTQSIFGINPPDFEKWCEAFEEGFGNAPIEGMNSKVFGDRIKPWNRDRNNRPKIKILNRIGENPNYIWAEFYPDWDNKEEAYFVTGTSFMCVQQIMSIWNFKQVITNGDFGQILGYPPTEWLQKRPTLGISVTFVLRTTKHPWEKLIPPNKIKRVQITIPFAKRSALTYENIRTALGGSSGLTWGVSSCLAWVADEISNYPRNKKGMPQIWCKGGSFTEAKANLKKVLPFTEGKVVSMNESKPDLSEDLNPLNSSNQTFKVYPYLLFVSNSRLLDFSNQRGRETRLGKLDTNKNRIEIWYEQKPSNFDRKIDALFKWD